MKATIEEVLETTQMIVPEIDLKVSMHGEEVHMQAVPLNYWHYYINAIEKASDLLVEELRELPDLEVITELETVATDLNSLISAFNLFYHLTLREIEQAVEPMRPQLERIARYRGYLPPDRKNDKN